MPQSELNDGNTAKQNVAQETWEWTQKTWGLSKLKIKLRETFKALCISDEFVFWILFLKEE